MSAYDGESTHVILESVVFDEPSYPQNLDNNEQNTGYESYSLVDESNHYGEDEYPQQPVEEWRHSGSQSYSPNNPRSPMGHRNDTVHNVTENYPPKDIFEVSLTTGEQVGEGLTAFQTYIINVKTTSKKYREQEFVQQRRYKDFLWLHERLSENFKGVIIPPIPEKTISFDRFRSDFVDYRRRELERFLRRVVSHPLLANSVNLQTFLEANESVLQEAKAPTSSFASQVASFFGVKMSALSTTIIPPIEIDPWFENKARYLNALEMQLTLFANAANAMVVKYNETTDINQDFSVCSAMLSTGEKETDKQLSSAFEQLSELQTQMINVNREMARSVKIHFEDALRDYIRLIASAKEMLSHRAEKLSEYQDVCHTHQVKNQKFKQLQDQPAPIPPNLEPELRRIETEMQEKKHNLDLISEACKRELQEFENTKSKELREALIFFARDNIEYNEKVQNMWKGLA